MAIAPRSAPNSSMTAEIRVGDCGTLAVASFDFVSTNLRKDVANIIYGKSVKRAETRRYKQKSFIPSKFAIEEKRWTGRQSLFPLSKIPWFFNYLARRRARVRYQSFCIPRRASIMFQVRYIETSGFAQVLGRLGNCVPVSVGPPVNIIKAS